MRCIWPALLARALLASEDAPLPDDCPSEDPLQLMQRQAAKLVAESNVSEGSFTSRWQGNRETGSWCLIYHCGKHLGPTECHHYRCVCQMGYQYSEMTKRCESESSSPVQRDTGGSCYFWGCARWRGPTECIHHKCMCLEGYRAVRGYCEKHEEPQPMTTTTAPGEGLAVATADPPAMQTSCAWGGQQCGGAGYTGATCCEAGYYCDGAACSKVTEAVEVKQYGFSDKLRKKSSGKLFTFYVYRAQGATTYPPENVNVADLAGVMWYLHNEIVGRADWGYKRKFNITRIIRYKMQTKATQPLIDRGMNFGVRFAFDSGQCTGPFSCDEAWQNYGYFVGCNKLQQGFPFPDFKVAYDGTWYSLPGKCPQMQYFEKTNSSKGSRGLDCLSHQPGGFCEEPSGTADCTYNFENAGEIDLDELEQISGDYNGWIGAGNREYDRITDHGTGMTFWDKLNDEALAKQRVAKAKALFEKHYPGSYEGIDEPPCDFDFFSFYKMAPGGYKDNGPQQPKPVTEPPCGDAAPGDKCYDEIKWAKSDGIFANPSWYPGLSPTSSDASFQKVLHGSGGTACPAPCEA
mmetsp:Transcript_143536/g.202958  ORF Transcript_143536/g.202958 Transcript_143536/m.202958 type:complete len:575 (-) Transcript_143536:50-1774(-)